MTNHHDPDEEGHGSRPREPEADRGPDAGAGRGPGAGPGEGPADEGGRGPGGGRAEAGDRPGEDEGTAGRGEGDGPRRSARRAWGDAFSEVQDVVGEVVGDVLEGVRDAAAGRFPRMDLIRVKGEGYRLLVDLPGLTREEVDVLTLGNELTVRGERPPPELPEGSEVLRSERAHGRFERTIRMPPDVREEGVAASFQDGVLTVRLPRSEPTDARTVDIG